LRGSGGRGGGCAGGVEGDVAEAGFGVAGAGVEADAAGRGGVAFKEEVQAFEGAGGAGFDFDGDDAGVDGEEKIDFGLAVEGFADPEVEGVLTVGWLGGEEFLGGELFGGGAAVDGEEVWLGNEFGVDAEGGVEEADVEEGEFDEAGVGLGFEREALSGGVGDLVNGAGFFEGGEGLADSGGSAVGVDFENFKRSPTRPGARRKRFSARSAGMRGAYLANSRR
jgi:hypothetical protein